MCWTAGFRAGVGLGFGRFGIGACAGVDVTAEDMWLAEHAPAVAPSSVSPIAPKLAAPNILPHIPSSSEQAAMDLADRARTWFMQIGPAIFAVALFRRPSTKAAA